MEKITTIGLDLAKHVFQVHGIDAGGQVMVRRQLRRGELLKFFEKQSPCLVGMEACGTSHYWAREIAALPRLVPGRRNLLRVPASPKRCARFCSPKLRRPLGLVCAPAAWRPIACSMFPSEPPG